MPMNSYSVRLKQVVEEFNLIVARESSDYDRIDLMVEGRILACQQFSCACLHAARLGQGLERLQRR